MTDLTKITAPFGLLDPETQEALRKWEHGVDCYEPIVGWQKVQRPTWKTNLTYRARPAPLVPDSIDWSHVAPEWKWMARDEGGTHSHFFEQKPYVSGDMWYVDKVNVLGITRAFASYRRGTVAWQDSLVQRPA